MDENKKTETAEVVGEKQLEHVAGGSSEPIHCWFNPVTWPQKARVEWQHGANRMWCNQTICNSGCACYGTNHCVDKWHLMDNEPQSPQLLPRGYKNHDAKNNNGLSNDFRDPSVTKK